MKARFHMGAVALLLLFCAQASSRSGEPDRKLASPRAIQARELLGRRHSEVEVARNRDVIRFVKNWVRRGLPRGYRAARVSKAVLDSSRKYGLDPMFLLAVAQNESSFRPKARGRHGEIGLMQLRPRTAKWIARRFHLPWKGPRTLEDPVANIRLGAAYLALLRDRFENHGRLYLAAFNLGPTGTLRAVASRHLPKGYPLRVMRYYLRFYSKVCSAEHRPRGRSRWSEGPLDGPLPDLPPFDQEAPELAQIDE